ncbi:MAG: UDP-N-acetylglucosamine 2-epimerase (non-hydrolyzing) [Pseudomonadota bacterium]
MSLHIVTIIGARPQFIKAAVVSRAVGKYNSKIRETIIHTGQHYDDNMSSLFFHQLDIPEPNFNLGIGSGSHGQMTGQMIIALEKAMIDLNPDVVLVYGDTNSTLAGALAASKHHFPVAHVEAGLRSYNKRMPEEQNRVLTDHLSSFLFCPTATAKQNLAKESIVDGVDVCGDVMLDASLYYRRNLGEKSSIRTDLNVDDQRYALVTCHREENTNSSSRFENIMAAIARISASMTVVFPAHPRISKSVHSALKAHGNHNVILTDPVGYFEMMDLQLHADAVLTDSGGVQKEAYFLRVPCLTMRDETEWIETLDSGANTLVGANTDTIIGQFRKVVDNPLDVECNSHAFGRGDAAERILDVLLDKH